ncbi:glycosyl-phosphatidylinositol-anchored molecule-like protein [Peromyscus eremicus]|uniref:glycosyl-phosphatidylinositol-anchored molecule-like protein n=1 Tax=Peromyscus eremicus TaxID=42410 RepID=UPI0027DCF587|nr:glycosyl-phosphatidylinositol-anchored molecule-like protein [Peromyscus eremicus]XP_059103626.1 glycosyl-phosphatidylinositol-anchored molecule-like protein [Peromyscus eremicus]XP_059103627.1 glycosyl-phosphatidylinositol-anchored molecule-like protein [Peromyscus eremicus]XP_059103628.1 glycosyl-phosphatidylinositol-anchored molecule-like protein [Peromyscus eremicus]XP_059103629.1 glycosyl-phosphatidylinositol-anchored molecule-like protein [Peromyscus eremicus]
MMHPFFLIILLGLPWVHTTVNNTSGLDNSTSGLDMVIKPRQEVFQCYLCAATNTFNCLQMHTCVGNSRRCAVIAIRMDSRQLLVYKNCVEDCSFALIQPPPTPRKLPPTTYFYYTQCCSGYLCNEGGPSNIERDLSPPVVIEEGLIARAVCLGEFNLLLNISLILSSSILI